MKKLFLYFIIIVFSFVCGNSTEAQRQPIAIVEMTKGDARVRRAGELNWHEVKKDAQLFAGDRTFVGKSGLLVLRYLKEQAQIKLNSRSVFEVTEELPVNTKMDKRIAIQNVGTQSDKLTKSESDLQKFLFDYFKDNSNSPEDSSVSVYSASSSEETGISVEWKVRERFLRYPIGVMNVRAPTFPTQFSLVLEHKKEKAKMFGFLWKMEKEKKTVWSGVSESAFENIPISKKGTYVFQAFSEDGREKTAPLVVHVEHLNLALKSENIIPNHLRFGDTVYIP